MANEPSALAVEPEAPSEDDYRAFCAALSETARGRAFLAEYARRQRAAHTDMLLAAVERLEGLVLNQVPQPASEPEAPPATPPAAIRVELHGLLDFISEVQSETDAGSLTMQVAKLASLVDVVRHRITDLVGAASTTGLEPADEWPPAPSAMPDAPTVELAIAAPAPSTAIPKVGWFDDLPAARAGEPIASAQHTPRPAAATSLAIAAVVEAAAAAAEAEPDAPRFTVFKAGTIPPPTPFAGEDFSDAPSAETAMPPPADAMPPADPLAPITSLSDDERLALFT